MKYLHLKDLIADIQTGVLDPKTILMDVDWEEETLEVFNHKDETIWDGSTSSAFLEIIHHCLGVLTIHDMGTALLEARSEKIAQCPNHNRQGNLDLSTEELFASLVKAAEKQSQQIPDKLNSISNSVFLSCSHCITILRSRQYLSEP